MAQFIKLIGFQNQETITVNLEKIISFSPNIKGGTNVVVDTKPDSTYYHVTISYDGMDSYVKEIIPQ